MELWSRFSGWQDSGYLWHVQLPLCVGRCVWGCQVYVAGHMACPFGAVASVHAWERVGAALTWLAQKFLKLALLRYVDDMFAPERRACGEHSPAAGPPLLCASGCRLETVKHGMQCLARLVRLLLGREAIADNKLDCGSGLTILGVRRPRPA